jgi:hypothetical protein
LIGVPSASAWASLPSLDHHLGLTLFFAIILSCVLLLPSSHLLLNQINSSGLSTLKNETDDEVSEVCVTVTALLETNFSLDKLITAALNCEVSLF